MGYGDPMATTIGYGPDANNKYTTTYFRRTFSAANGFSTLTLDLWVASDFARRGPGSFRPQVRGCWAF